MSHTDTDARDVQPIAGSLHVGIVGAGPSGCYAAQALRKANPELKVTVLDSSPTPFGLIRYGIAPDHQGAKAVTRQFDRLFAQDGVEFVGNVRVGTDVSVEQLLDHFHAVVVATGLGSDKVLPIPQDPEARIVGSGALVRLLNSDPDSALRSRQLESLGEEIVILGTGNVAVDVARLLVKSDLDFIASDVDDVALRTVAPNPVKKISILGRCEPHLAKWDPSMLKELAEVVGVHLNVDGVPLLGADAKSPRTTVDVWFQQEPISIHEFAGRAEVTTRHTDGSGFIDTVVADTVVTALGCDLTAANRETFEELDDPRVFRAGGPATGRLGNLAENRKYSAEVAKEIVTHLATTSPAPRSGLFGLREHLPETITTFQSWKRVDEAELLRARPDRCRTKFTTRAELLAAAAELTPSPLAASAAASTQEN